MKEARVKANEIIEQAHQRANQMIDQAKPDAIAEADRQKALAQAEIDAAANRAREDLRTQVSALAVSGAEKLLRREIDAERPQGAARRTGGTRSDEPGADSRPSLRARRVRAARRDEHAFAAWSQALAFAARVAADPQVASLLGDPRLTPAERSSCCRRTARMPIVRAFPRRCWPTTGGCALLPEIAALFEQLRAKPSAWSRRR